MRSSWTTAPIYCQPPIPKTLSLASGSHTDPVPTAASRPRPPSAGSPREAPSEELAGPDCWRRSRPGLPDSLPSAPPARGSPSATGGAEAVGGGRGGSRPAGSPRGLRSLVTEQTRLPQPLLWLLLLTHPPRRLCSTATGCLATGAAGLSGARSLALLLALSRVRQR